MLRSHRLTRFVVRGIALPASARGVFAVERPIRFAGARLDRYYHACAFFRSDDEAYAVLVPFIQDGLEGREKVIHITDPRRREDHRRRLIAGGIDVDAVERAGQLEVLNWEDAYLRGGRFDPDAMLALVEEVTRTSHETGFPRARIVGHMEWALEDRSGVGGLLEYEARANDVLTRLRQPAVCVYDTNRFGASTMIDLVRTHPIVVMGGTFQENPFFVPPEEFLRELDRRRRSAS
jgi:hypothetical protein